MAGEPNTYSDTDLDEIVADKDKRIAELEAALRAMVKDCGDGAVMLEAGRLAMREAVRVLTKSDA